MAHVPYTVAFYTFKITRQKVTEDAGFSIYGAMVSICLELRCNGGRNKEVNVHAALSVHILTRCGLKLREAQMVDRVENCDG